MKDLTRRHRATVATLGVQSCHQRLHHCCRIRLAFCSVVPNRLSLFFLCTVVSDSSHTRKQVAEARRSTKVVIAHISCQDSSYPKSFLICRFMLETTASSIFSCCFHWMTLRHDFKLRMGHLSSRPARRPP